MSIRNILAISLIFISTAIFSSVQYESTSKLPDNAKALYSTKSHGQHSNTIYHNSIKPKQHHVIVSNKKTKKTIKKILHKKPLKPTLYALPVQDAKEAWDKSFETHPPKTSLSKKSLLIKIGMQKSEVLRILGHPTWADSQVGTPLVLAWRNSNCNPIQVSFSSTYTVREIDGGRAECYEEGKTYDKLPASNLLCKNKRKLCAIGSAESNEDDSLDTTDQPATKGKNGAEVVDASENNNTDSGISKKGPVVVNGTTKQKAGAPISPPPPPIIVNKAYKTDLNVINNVVFRK